MDNQLPEVELIPSTVTGSITSFPFSEAENVGAFVNATMNIAGIELNTVDVALVVLCPVFACLGILVASLLKSMTSPANTNIIQRFFSGIYANVANLFIGLVVGIVISLFFVGSINNDISSLARVLVLTIFLGYKAPLIWNIKRALAIDDNHPDKASAKNKAISSTKVVAPKVKSATVQVAIDQDLLKQERLKRAKLKLAAKG